VTTITQDRPLLARLLLESGVLREDQLEEFDRKVGTRPDNLEDALIINQLVDDSLIAETYARFLGVSWLDVVHGEEQALIVEHCQDGSQKDLGNLDDVTESCRPLAMSMGEMLCRRHRLIPLRQTTDHIEVASVQPVCLAAVQEIEMRSGCDVRTVAITHSLLMDIHEGLFGQRDMVREIVTQEFSAGMLDEEGEDGDFALDLARPVQRGRESQVVRIVNVLLSKAIEKQASDIHIEPYEESVRVRYRIDGHLIETTPPPRSMFVPTISRLKILSKMDIAEKRVPQDGSIAARLGERRVDLRVSTIPTVFGEKMVIRILEKGSIPNRLQDLGLTDAQAQQLLTAAASSHGLVFVTGPTGSGKSTTLYTCLKLINRPTENIVTVEDPVEYKFHGINQVTIRSNVGLTFAAALRSLLRQDPDKMMVGEVRDQETAQICLRAALTGHLVLSTLHTNTSLQVINRLMEMGVEPFLLGPALRLVQAQRLVRCVCPNCRVAYELPEDVARRHQLPPGATLYRARKGGCEACRGLGSRGRIGLYEVVPVGEHLRELIMGGASLADMEHASRAEGVEFLADSARRRLLSGSTTLEEVSEYLRCGS
jgi:type IV pilus assembly protein PilB